MRNWRTSAGVPTVCWLTPADTRAPSVDAAFAGFTRPAAEAFHRHGVGRVVGVSMLGRGTRWAGRAGFVTGSLAMDDLPHWRQHRRQGPSVTDDSRRAA